MKYCILFLIMISLSCKTNNKNIKTNEVETVNQNLKKTTYKLSDLNGDSVLDTIDYKITKNYYEFTLKVNGAEYNGQGDIDTNDKFLEIAIKESGPSDDFATYFFYYENDTIVKMGKLPGTYDIIIDGSGIINTRKRGKILHTWFFPAEYRLNDIHHLEFIDQELYIMNRSFSMKDTLNIQKSPDDSTIIVTVYPGDRITIIGCDNKKWCLVETSNNINGWFAVKGYSHIIGIGKDVYEIFDGLSNAD